MSDFITNGELRIEAEHLCDENERLQTENAKLQELVRTNCDKCGIKKIYMIDQVRRSEASKLARETIKAARERKVDIGDLIKLIATEYAAHEASYAEREACISSYEEGYNDGFVDGR